MGLSRDHARARAILLDIEGTTTPVEFVYEVLFPHARAHLRTFLEAHAGETEVAADVAALREEHRRDAERKQGPPPWRAGAADLDSVARYAFWLMDCDRKSTALKSLQGKVWEAGYRSGELRGQVFADVPPALARWQRQGRETSIFSSGSVLAQQLLFAHSTAGDLTPFIRAYFDTTTGPKTEAESYRRIAAALGGRAPDVLFLSDVAAELDAARVAGMKTALCVRSGEPAPAAHPVVRSFDAVCP